MRLDLAALEAEAHAEDDEREPFELDLGDGSDPVILPHSADMNLEQLEAFFDAERTGDPFGALAALVGGGETYAIFAKKATGPGLNLLLTQWREYAGLPSPGEARASRPSLTGSARQSKQTSRTTTRRSA